MQAAVARSSCEQTAHSARDTTAAWRCTAVKLASVAAHRRTELIIMSARVAIRPGKYCR